MRLRTFESFWLLKNGILYSYPSLEADLTTEIIVLGGGITGALISHALMDAGYKVILLDKRDIAMGSTSATTSMLQYEIDTNLKDLADMIGLQPAVDCYQAGIKAIHDLEALIAAQGINCSFSTKQSLYIAHNKKAARDLYQEFLIRDAHQLGVQWLDQKEVLEQYGIHCFGAILSATAASVDAYQLAHELIQLNVQRGMQVYDQVAIDTIDTAGPQPVIRLANGFTMKAKQLVCCTGFEATTMLQEKIAHLFYTYACVSEQNIMLNRSLANTLVWDTASPYFYMRTTDDNRLLIGGEDAAHGFSFFQQKIKERKAKKLQEKLAKMIPGTHFIEDYSWGGMFGSTKDGLPYIGASPEHSNTLFVLGFGGNGITFSIQGMEMIPALLRGEPHPLAAYYRFGR